MRGPRVLLALPLFDQPLSERRRSEPLPSVQAVLPRWQLSRQGPPVLVAAYRAVSSAARSAARWRNSSGSNARAQDASRPRLKPQALVAATEPETWRQRYAAALTRGIASGQQRRPAQTGAGGASAPHRSGRHLRPLAAVQAAARQRHRGSCRFLWQRHMAVMPSSVHRRNGCSACAPGQLRSDALAGTASQHQPPAQLLRSDKDRREHELVVETITDQLRRNGLTPRRRRQPQLARHGNLTHLHTPITAETHGQPVLALAEQLHPTPAVAGLPRRDAMAWLRTLEPFERGSYAAPIGWIDSAGDAELRVAIRCGHARGCELDLTAGAGLVRGSVAERELQEVGLKLAVLADQLELQTSARNRSIV